MAMGVADGWMDVIAFPYADLEEETFVEIPKGVTSAEYLVWKHLKYL